MTLSEWLAELAHRGITGLPPTTAVPVELHASLPDGRGLHFRCRGTRVTLRLFGAEAVQLAVPVREATPTELPLVTEVRLPLAGAQVVEHQMMRVVFTGPAAASVVLDGGERFGWSGYEAGLLRVSQARLLFEELLTTLVPELALVPA